MNILKKIVNNTDKIGKVLRILDDNSNISFTNILLGLSSTNLIATDLTTENLILFGLTLISYMFKRWSNNKQASQYKDVLINAKKEISKVEQKVTSVLASNEETEIKNIEVLNDKIDQLTTQLQEQSNIIDKLNVHMGFIKKSSVGSL